MSERNYNSQSCWITLYVQVKCYEDQNHPCLNIKLNALEIFWEESNRTTFQLIVSGCKIDWPTPQLTERQCLSSRQCLLNPMEHCQSKQWYDGGLEEVALSNCIVSTPLLSHDCISISLQYPAHIGVTWNCSLAPLMIKIVPATPNLWSLTIKTSWCLMYLLRIMRFQSIQPHISKICCGLISSSPNNCGRLPG